MLKSTTIENGYHLRRMGLSIQSSDIRRKWIAYYTYGIIGMILLIIISFHYLTNFSAYWGMLPIRQKTIIGQTTFELLDFEQCRKRCHHIHDWKNLYLLSVSSRNDSAVWAFMKELKPLNQCQTLVLIQYGNTITPNWKDIIQTPIMDAVFPNASFALCYWDVHGRSFSITDLAKGKVNGKWKLYHLDGEIFKLFIEQDVKDNKSDGKKIVYDKGSQHIQIWKDDQLISEYTINKKDSL